MKQNRSLLSFFLPCLVRWRHEENGVDWLQKSTLLANFRCGCAEKTSLYAVYTRINHQHFRNHLYTRFLLPQQRWEIQSSFQKNIIMLTDFAHWIHLADSLHWIYMPITNSQTNELFTKCPLSPRMYMPITNEVLTVLKIKWANVALRENMVFVIQ